MQHAHSSENGPTTSHPSTNFAAGDPHPAGTSSAWPSRSIATGTSLPASPFVPLPPSVSDGGAAASCCGPAGCGSNLYWGAGCCGDPDDGVRRAPPAPVVWIAVIWYGVLVLTWSSLGVALLFVGRHEQSEWSVCADLRGWALGAFGALVVVSLLWCMYPPLGNVAGLTLLMVGWLLWIRAATVPCTHSLQDVTGAWLAMGTVFMVPLAVGRTQVDRLQADWWTRYEYGRAAHSKR